MSSKPQTSFAVKFRLSVRKNTLNSLSAICHFCLKTFPVHFQKKKIKDEPLIVSGKMLYGNNDECSACFIAQERMYLRFERFL
jgi:hypothetical protein